MEVSLTLVKGAKIQSHRLIKDRLFVAFVIALRFWSTLSLMTIEINGEWSIRNFVTTSGLIGALSSWLGLPFFVAEGLVRSM
jgi:hypothetical protein